MHRSLSLGALKKLCMPALGFALERVGHAVLPPEPALEQRTSLRACSARRRKQADAGARRCRVGMELPTVEVRFENVQARPRL